jgi:hypothetical protein
MVRKVNLKKKLDVMIIILLFFSCFNLVTQTSALKYNDNYEFVIITPSKFSDDLIALKDHKEVHDISTRIVTLDEVYAGTYFPLTGRDVQEQIKYFIKNAVEIWSTSYVMLVGNKEDMPARYVSTYLIDGTHTYYFSDLYYADVFDDQGQFASWDTNNDNRFADKGEEGYIDDVDLYPDVYIGRILCRNSEEVIDFSNKVITYENTAYNKPWFKNFVTCGADDCRGLFLEALLPFLLNRIGRISLEGEYMGDQVAHILSDFNTKKIYGSGLFRLNSKFLTTKNINDAINEGAGFLMFVGHGKPHIAISTQFPFCKNIWLPKPSAYSISDVQTLSNGEKLPVAIFAGCNCGDFDALNSPVAWEFIRHTNGGAIASIACTSGAIMILSNLCAKSFHGHLILSIFRSYKSGKDRIGDIWSDSITEYLNDEEALKLGDDFSMLNWNDTLSNHFVIEVWALFGDPTLKIGGYP